MRMSRDWYYAVEGQTRGPVRQQQLMQLVEQGRIEEATLVWHADLGDWTPLASLPWFERPVEPPPPPPPVLPGGKASSVAGGPPPIPPALSQQSVPIGALASVGPPPVRSFQRPPALPSRTSSLLIAVLGGGALLIAL